MQMVIWMNNIMKMGNIIENKYIQSEDSKRKYQPTVDKNLVCFNIF